ncbi:MAG: hypothetical protein ACRDPB_10980 [Nocardioidaceae bacterium]
MSLPPIAANVADVQHVRALAAAHRGENLVLQVRPAEAQIVDLRVRKAYAAPEVAPGWLINLCELGLPLEEEST